MHSDLDEDKKLDVSERLDSRMERILSGIPISPGVAEGPIWILQKKRSLSIPQYTISDEEFEQELEQLKKAIARTRQQIKQLQEKLAKQLGAKEEARLFDAHLLVLEDPVLYEHTVKYMKEKHYNVARAFATASGEFIKALSSIEDSYMKERAADVKDITNRVLRNLLACDEDAATVDTISEQIILVATELTPSETATLDRNKIAGIATDIGAQTSHVAILARALGIPAVTGLNDAAIRLRGGEPALLDGYTGQLIIYPSERTRFQYKQLIIRRRTIENRFLELRDKPAITPDGRRIILSANIEKPEEVDQVLEVGAEGVGLFRTEYLFLGRSSLPDEEEQYQAYVTVAKSLAPQPVIIRTMDLGGDKMLALKDVPQEHNPFLGWRAIRLCLQERDLFRKQIRAILRAAVSGNVKIMYPMISDIDEVLQANDFVEECKEELKKEGLPYAENIEIGVMIEIPSAALQARTLAKNVDFFSIGTNDLIQYTLAVDRMNPRIAHLYKPTHPAVIKLIHMTIKAAKEEQIWVGVCGEVAADPLLVPLLLGLGVDELSVNPRALPLIKYVIRHCPLAEARALAEFALQSENTEQIMERAQLFFASLLPELQGIV